MINLRAFAAAVAVIWGGAMVFLGWVAPFGYGEPLVTLLSSLYLGYGPGFLGGLIGGAWGVVDGGIGGLVFAWLYNWFARKFDNPAAEEGGGS